MPYTKPELETIDFYQSFVKGLRTKYLKELKEYAETGFRQNGVLYSFEDIISTAGIEDAQLSNNMNSLYNTYLTVEQQESVKTLNNYFYPRYIKTKTLEKVVDRSISELAESKFAEKLPDDIENGDVVTNEDAKDFRRWLIDTNQKRIFPDLATYYGRGYALGGLKTLNKTVLETIPDGEPVE